MPCGNRSFRCSLQVCTFLAPLLQAGLVRVSAEAVCELPGLGHFAEVPLLLSIEIYDGLFSLDPGESQRLPCVLIMRRAHIERLAEPGCTS